MRLAGLRLENFKPFAAPTAIDVATLTVLIGRNSSGKRALARSPLLIARALSPEALAPLELDVSGVDFGASFLDLVHNRLPHGAVSIGATLADDRQTVPFDSTIQHVD